MIKKRGNQRFVYYGQSNQSSDYSEKKESFYFCFSQTIDFPLLKSTSGTSTVLWLQKVVVMEKRRRGVVFILLFSTGRLKLLSRQLLTHVNVMEEEEGLEVLDMLWKCFSFTPFHFFYFHFFLDLIFIIFFCLFPVHTHVNRNALFIMFFAWFALIRWAFDHLIFSFSSFFTFSYLFLFFFLSIAKHFFCLCRFFGWYEGCKEWSAGSEEGCLPEVNLFFSL
jgi:hypothetical protein